MKKAKKCVRCGLTRKEHSGMENFCPKDKYGRTFVYPKTKKVKKDKE